MDQRPLQIAQLVTRVADGLLPAPTLAERQAWRSAPNAEHARLYDAAACLHQVEYQPPPAPTAPRAAGALRVVFWNAERLKAPERAAALLRPLAPDVVLLAEVDRGMARSDNRHTTRDLAGLLGHGYVFGVEFIELSRGNAHERAATEGQDNADGLHGGAVTAHGPLHRPALVRLERDGGWFVEGRGDQRRVGGRIAVLATLPLAETELVVASVHLESDSSPQMRAEQFAALLEAVDCYAEDRPVLIGGDLNTASVQRPEEADPAYRAALARTAPDRFVDPVPYEPLFELAAAHGYRWSDLNVPGVATQRPHPFAAAAPPLAKLDWFLVRGLSGSDARVVPAVDPEGTQALADHEVLLVTVKLHSAGTS